MWYDADMTFMNNPSPITDMQLDMLLSSQILYDDWHPDIKKIVDAHPELRFPKKASLQHKMVNILAHNPTHSFARPHLEKIAVKLGIKSDDIIQSINKTTQWGLERWTKKFDGVTHYAVPEIKFISKHTRVTYTALDGESKKDSEKRAREYFLALSEEANYEIGHKAPRFPISADNFVVQPASINRPHKDKYIFDDNGLPKVPNPERFARNPELFYSKEDLKAILEGIKSFFGEQ